MYGELQQQFMMKIITILYDEDHHNNNFMVKIVTTMYGENHHNILW